jgi:hypothetical protein
MWGYPWVEWRMPTKPLILLHARRMNSAGISAIWGRSTLRSRVHSSRSNSARSSARSSLLSRGRRRFTIANGSWLLRRAFGFAFCCAARQSSANAFLPTLSPTLQIRLCDPLQRPRPRLNPHRIALGSTVIVFKNRHSNNGAKRFDSLRPVRIFRVGQDIRNMDSPAFERGAGGTPLTAAKDWRQVQPRPGR